MEAAQLDASDPRAYIRLTQRLRKQIAEGELLPGDATPSITELAEEHGHARHTCSKALRLLVDEGVVHRVPGLGYYVAGDALRVLTGSGNG
jgi:DNA-binding GntR family transcriptional regulator